MLLPAAAATAAVAAAWKLTHVWRFAPNTPSAVHAWCFVLAAAVRQIIQEVTPALSFLSRCAVLSSVKSHYLLTYNQHFVEIIKVSTDSYFSQNNKCMLWNTREVQSLVDACHKDCDKFCLHKRPLWSTHLFLHCFLCICQYPMNVKYFFFFFSAPWMYAQSVHMYKMLMLVFYCSCSRQRNAPLPSLLCASSAPRSPKLLLI